MLLQVLFSQRMLLLFHAVSYIYVKVMVDWLLTTAPLIKQQQQPVQICTVYSNRYSLDIIDSLARLSLRQVHCCQAVEGNRLHALVVEISRKQMHYCRTMEGKWGEHVAYISWWMLVTVVSQTTIINNSYTNWLNHVKPKCYFTKC